MRRRELLKSAGPGLTGTGFSAVQPTKAEPENPRESTSSRLSCYRLQEYLNEGAKKVDLFENSTVAIAEISNPAPNKIQSQSAAAWTATGFAEGNKRKGYEFCRLSCGTQCRICHPRFFGDLGFLLLLPGLLFLRTSVNTPGGPNLPFGLGR